ncbi:MAG: hypothetical protein ACE5G1_02445 [bacterium]
MRTVKNCFLFTILGLIVACGGEKRSENYGKYSRAELRYYAYAPPFIPHQILNRKCLDCHQDGLVVEGFKAPVTPHPELQNCQQCHVRADEDVRLFKENKFVGLPEPQKVVKPQPSGPPLIPHRVFMREQCLVCHGDASRREVTQTTHPERQNCLQCHIEQHAQVSLFRSEFGPTNP